MTLSASESASAFESPLPWPDTPGQGPLDRQSRRARLSVVPGRPDAPAQDPGDDAPAASAVPGAHNGALFDWARQLPEWGGEAGAPPAAETPPVPAPRAARRPAAAAPAAPRRPQRAAPDPRPAAPSPGANPALELWQHRLTRRGRIVVVSAATVLATAALAVLFTGAATAGASASGAPTETALSGQAPATVVVQDGDTLWDIAQRVRPGDDPRSTVHEIVRVNGLSESELEPGQELVMPDF
ncbi:LysM peptidoglycan-binding domain-containing protein [Streptomonospora sp. PA3]|uniref:LysM peptidoglycan-binding domain-containing protein n=1 Tax=Streptomonospora sp. PA3 TaxID=2607326 RepID=UPI0012DDB40F|nr:LysM peptidoglycan-binding domain-containing protein [Streptomonospora sp. PA3]MUL43013.1 LysM peptidoglycan-binding domain-containing protein [Streptomonospora sp. PA3]